MLLSHCSYRSSLDDATVLSSPEAIAKALGVWLNALSIFVSSHDDSMFRHTLLEKDVLESIKELATLCLELEVYNIITEMSGATVDTVTTDTVTMETADTFISRYCQLLDIDRTLSFISRLPLATMCRCWRCLVDNFDSMLSHTHLMTNI